MGIKLFFLLCPVLPKHSLFSSMRLTFLLLAFSGFSKASLFQARSGRWEVCQYQLDTNGQYQLGVCVPGTDCDSAQSLEEVEIWKTFRSAISRSGKVVKTVRYRVERCNSELGQNLIPDSRTFDSKICSNTAYHMDEYLVRDDRDCRRFYSCQRTLRSRGWVARHMSCAPGTHFDGARCQAGEDCVNQSHSGSTIATITSKDTTTTKLKPTTVIVDIDSTTTERETTQTTTSTSITSTTMTTRAPASTTTTIPTTTTTMSPSTPSSTTPSSLTTTTTSTTSTTSTTTTTTTTITTSTATPPPPTSPSTTTTTT